MLELGSSGSVLGVPSNEHPYRDPQSIWAEPRRHANGRNRRTAAARRQAETFLERPVFGIKRPFSNAWGIRDPRGGQISIQRRRRDAEAMCDLSHAFEPVRELPAEIGCVAVIGAGQRDLEGRVWSPIPPVPSIGSPAVFHSGNPSSSRRAR